MLRPETAESLFVLWRLTRRHAHRNAAWALFSAFRNHSRTAQGAYASLDDVFGCHSQDATSSSHACKLKTRDDMPSFWLAETLKYLYLIFDDDALPLNRFVFNTEAHPLPLE